MDMPVASGFFEGLKEKFALNMIVQKIKDSKETIIAVGIYLALGFLVGFLIRRFSRVLVWLILFIVALAVLQYAGYVSIDVHFTKIQEMLGLREAISQDSLAPHLVEWFKNNIPTAVAAVIGLLLGLRT